MGDETEFKRTRCLDGGLDTLEVGRKQRTIRMLRAVMTRAPEPSCHLRELPRLQVHGASGPPPSSPWKAAAPHVHYQPCFKTEVTISLENESLKLVSHAWSWLHLGGIYTKKRERNLCGFTSAAGACFYFLLGLACLHSHHEQKTTHYFP